MTSAQNRVAVLIGLGLMLFGLGTTSRVQERPQDASGPGPTPRQIWERFRATLPPLDYRIEKDEIVPSDTDPRLKLRRIEVKFYSQEINGRAWDHPCVVFLPADRKVYNAARRRGKIVIVGQRSWERDLVWYPEFMINTGGDVYEGYVKGKLPDAWLIEVKDIARSYASYLSSLPQDITGMPTATRTSRGSRSRLWEPKKKD